MEFVDYSKLMASTVWFESHYAADVNMSFDFPPAHTGSTYNAESLSLSVKITAGDFLRILQDLRQLDDDRVLRQQHRDLAEEWARYEALRGLLASLNGWEESTVHDKNSC